MLVLPHGTGEMRSMEKPNIRPGLYLYILWPIEIIYLNFFVPLQQGKMLMMITEL
jgi:hypothetical protein